MAKLTNLRSRLSGGSVSRLSPLADRNVLRGKPSERGYDAWWRPRAAAHLAAHPFCVYCALDGRETKAELVDHLYPAGIRPGHRTPEQLALFRSTANWVSCCHACHRGMKRKVEAQGVRAIDELSVRIGREPLRHAAMREACAAALDRAYATGGGMS